MVEDSGKLEIDELGISSSVWQITEQAHLPYVKQMLPTGRKKIQHVGMNCLSFCELFQSKCSCQQR